MSAKLARPLRKTAIFTLSAPAVGYELFSFFDELITLYLADVISPKPTAIKNHKNIKKIHIKFSKKIVTTTPRIIIKGIEII